MYGCDSWTVKKAEHQWVNVFELWCWRRLLRVPWKTRRSNQSISREINPEYSLEGLMLKLKLQYFGHLMRTGDSLEKSLMLGKTEGRRKRGHQRMRWLDDITNAMDINLGKLWEMVRKREAWGTSTYGVTKSQTWLDDWTTATSGYGGPVSFFCMWLSRFSSTIYWRESLFFHLHCWLSCYELTDHTCAHLFLGSQFSSIDLCVCSYVNIILFWLL